MGLFCKFGPLGYGAWIFTGSPQGVYRRVGEHRYGSNVVREPRIWITSSSSGRHFDRRRTLSSAPQGFECRYN